jgi:ketosteroid isomerase-like protein
VTAGTIKRRGGGRAVVAGLAVGLAVPALYREAVRRMFRFNVRRLNAGDLRPLVRTYADDVRFTFPGASSWGGTFVGRAAVERWVGRFVEAGLQLEPNDIVVDGPPWATRACLRFTDRYTAPDGTIAYHNEGVIYARIAWGRLTSYEVHEDTHKTTAFDAYLAERGLPGAPPFPSVQDAAGTAG